jgi:8-oxo-dGTP pyrophosphatase MutT (NUDIX family)
MDGPAAQVRLLDGVTPQPFLAADAPWSTAMIKTIADFASEDMEAGVGLVLQDAGGRYLFFLAGTRHQCPAGELFYAGIGGHREAGENWLECAHREAMEEMGTDIDILSAPVTWHVPRQGPVQRVEVSDRPRPVALYEMVHPPDTPRAGELYRIVILQARMRGQPGDLPPEEVQGIIALTEEQVAQGLERKPRLAELLEEGASLVAGAGRIDSQVRLYPLGTARALAHLLRQVGRAKE